MKQRVEVLEFLVKWKKLMENHTGRKINGIVTHLTNEKVGVAKEMNNVLLEKERYLLSNALLEKLF